ncbi:MAG: 2-hydroxyacyl-CoA dehydratase [wastewater metagenome]|nr:2-hydroxyacyl-CoA dehydratase [Candidatus Loosdrechtia aerotolerans]
MSIHTEFLTQVKKDCLQDNKGCIGYLSIQVPEEIIIAAGKIPFRVFGRGRPVKLANAYLPKTFDPYILDSLEGALDGSYAFLDGTVIANTSDAHRRLYDVWRLAAGPMRTFFLDVPKSANALGLKAFRLALSFFVKDIEKTLGLKISEEGLRDAMRLCNKTRFLLRELSEARKGLCPPFSGKEFFEIIRWSQTSDKQRVNEIVEEYCKKWRNTGNDIVQPKDAECGVCGPRILLTGSFMGSPDLIALIERLGAVVVYEDLCTGAQYFSSCVEEDSEEALDALARRYLSLPQARMVDTEARWNYLLQMVNDYHVDGVIYFALKFDDIHLFEYPHIRNKFQRAGYPVLYIEAENFLTTSGQIETRVQAFIEMLE